MADDVAQQQRHFDPIRRLAGAQNDGDRLALHGAQQALQHIIEPDIWQSASQTFCRMDNWTIARVKRDRC